MSPYTSLKSVIMYRFFRFRAERNRMCDGPTPVGGCCSWEPRVSPGPYGQIPD